MKYLAFILFALTATPVMTLAAMSSARMRSWLLSALVFSTALGDVSNVNFVSMELYRGPERGFELGLTDLISIALATALVLKFRRRLKWLPANSALMALFFTIAAISTVQAQEPLLGVFTLFKALRFFQNLSFRLADVSLAVNQHYVGIATEEGGMAPEAVFEVRNAPARELYEKTIEASAGWRSASWWGTKRVRPSGVPSASETTYRSSSGLCRYFSK